MQPKLIAIDLDGTLLHSDGTLGTKQLEACRRASQKCTIAIATGRRPVRVKKILAQFDFPYYLISSSGARLQHFQSGKYLLKRFIPASTLSEIVNLISNFGVSGILFCEESNEGRDVIFLRGKRVHPVMKMYIKANEPFMLGTITPSDPLPCSVFCLTSIGDETELERLQNSIPPSLLAQINTHLVRNLSIPGAAFDILPLRASKWQTLCRLAEMLGIDKSHTAAIGDDANDLDMIINSGISIAMANAREEILKAADFVTLTNDNDGVSHAFETILGV